MVSQYSTLETLAPLSYFTGEQINPLMSLVSAGLMVRPRDIAPLLTGVSSPVSLQSPPPNLQQDQLTGISTDHLG